MSSRLNTVALLGRDTGIAVLNDCLLKNDRLNIVQVFTHRYLTKAEGSGERPELNLYSEICKAHRIELIVLDFPEAKEIEHYLSNERLDLLVVLSWKFKVTTAALDRFTTSRINLHRGDIKKYPGLTPVLRAIKNKERRVAITAHEMTEEVDSGDEIVVVWKSIDQCPSHLSPATYSEIVKEKIKPLYALVLNLAIESILDV